MLVRPWRTRRGGRSQMSVRPSRVRLGWRGAALAGAALLATALAFLGYRRGADRERHELLAEVARRLAATAQFHSDSERHELENFAVRLAATPADPLVEHELGAYLSTQRHILAASWVDGSGIARLRRGTPDGLEERASAAIVASSSDVRRTGRTVYSPLFEYGSGEPVFACLIPVGPRAVAGVLVALYSVPLLLQHVTGSDLPEGVDARLLDDSGRTLATTRPRGTPAGEGRVALAGSLPRLTLSVWDSAPLVSGGAAALWLLCGFLATSMTLAIVALREQLTASRAAEAARRESEARFGYVADAAPVMIWMSGPDRGRTFFNRPWLDFTGRALEQELGDGWERGVHPADSAACLMTHREAFEARRAFTLEYRLLRADGVHRWVLDSGIPRHDPSGRFRGFVGSCIDITERRRTEDDLRASEERLRLLVRGLDAIVWEGDSEGFTLVSGAADAPLGYPIAEWLRPGFWAAHVHPDDRERAIGECVSATARGADHVLSYRMLTADGKVVWVTDRARALRASDGKLLLTGLMIDITATVELENALRRAADEWTRTFDALDAALVLLTVDGRVLRLNRSAQELAGCTFRECLGRRLDELSPAEPWHSAAALVSDFAGDGPCSRQISDAGGAQSWDLSVEAIAANANTPARVILMLRNVTAVVELQESIRKAKTMAALGALVAGVAHEVRNPLFAMSVNIDALEIELRDAHGLGEILDALRHERDRIGKLMEDLLDFGRPAPLQLTPGHLGPVVRAAVAASRLLAQRHGVQVVVQGDGVGAPDPGPVVSMDPARLQQVFLNLIENACQHAPAGSRVAIEWELRQGDDGSSVLCTVTDQGPGIADDVVGHVFEPFITRRPGGTGLGLSIVQRIVEAHGGSVTAANRPPGGACLSVSLPLA